MLVSLGKRPSRSSGFKWIKKDDWTASLAYHDPLLCQTARACVHIYGLTETEKKKLRRRGLRPYPLVHQRNLLTLLKHEEIHHILHLLLGRVLQEDMFDNIAGNLAETRRILEVT